MEIELTAQNIPHEPQKDLFLEYRGHRLRQTNKPDFICYGKIIVELKAVSNLVDEHQAQLLNYLHATGLNVGLLVNFGHFPKIEHERFVI